MSYHVFIKTESRLRLPEEFVAERRKKGRDFYEDVCEYLTEPGQYKLQLLSYQRTSDSLYASIDRPIGDNPLHVENLYRLNIHAPDVISYATTYEEAFAELMDKIDHPEFYSIKDRSLACRKRLVRRWYNEGEVLHIKPFSPRTYLLKDKLFLSTERPEEDVKAVSEFLRDLQLKAVRRWLCKQLLDAYGRYCNDPQREAAKWQRIQRDLNRSFSFFQRIPHSL
ncbi:MAG: hypothetical protein ACI8W8_002510 [Rhodothermales bacterium]|jgi:hypothetical protein